MRIPNMIPYSKELAAVSTCYELAHTWTPSCRQCAWDIARDGYSACVKIYAPLYLIAALIRRQKLSYYFTNLIIETLRSALFLDTNASVFIASFCVIRRLMGKFYFISVFLPGAVGSFAAISVERKSRRPMLATYLAMLATETSYNMLSSRGLIPDIPYGEVWLFSAVTGLALYMYRRGILDGQMQSLLQFILGDTKQNTSKSGLLSFLASKRSQLAQALKALPLISRLIRFLETGTKHELCNHDNGCILHIIQSFFRTRLIGIVLHFAFGLLTSFPSLVKRPSAVFSILRKPSNRQFGAFLGSFVAIYKLVLCLLHRSTNSSKNFHSFIAGTLAGLSMLFYRSSALALYLASKLAEIIYFLGVKNRYRFIPYSKCGDKFIYTVCMGFLLHVAAFEPHNIRPAYWQFLLRLTNNRLAYMNRKLLDPFGTKASTLLADWNPVYDRRLAPNLFPSDSH